MNWNLVGSVALKIGVAVLSGIAVFISVDKAVKKPNNNVNNPTVPNAPASTPAPGQEAGCGEKIEAGLRAAGETGAKIVNVMRDLGSIVSSTRRLFGNGDVCSQPFNGNWNYGPSINPRADGTSWTRVSPFIIEAGPGLYNSNNYPY